MGAMAKGKINASEARIGDRIVVKVYEASREEDQVALGWVSEQKGETVTRAIGPSRTKTGAGVVVTTITDKAKVANRRGYWITTGEGEFYAEPIQTMWSAQEDAPGVKRAHAEALEMDKAFNRAATPAEIETAEQAATEIPTIREAADKARAAGSAEEAAEIMGAALNMDPADLAGWAEANWTESQALNLAEAEAAREENEAPGGIYHGTEWASPAAPETSQAEDLTLNSHAGKVVDMNNDANNAEAREATGSAVVRLMERVHERIRQNHPEVPAVVIVTGAGIGPMGGKWGHFRPQGWTAGEAEHIHEMFMAGETLAKGARQVLQTMLHESAHALAETRGEQDTSRQGRWHNKVFLKIAGELGLEYRKDKANPQIGYSEVVLKDETVDEYRDLLDALETEIHLMVRLPGWLGGKTGGDDEDEGGENMPKAPKPPAAPNTNNIKCVCDCEEPNIIRMSRKVLAQGVVRCDECEAAFHEAA